MRVVSAAEIDQALDYPSLVDALADAFAGAITAPPRHHHTIPRAGAPATLLLMPAWHHAAGFVGIKSVTVFPDNAALQKPSVMGSYLLLAGETGEPLALMDGVALTLRRTAAASALAARHLAREDARRMTMIGAGALAPHLIAAHAATRPIERVTIWNRSRAAAERLRGALLHLFPIVEVSADRETALRSADIVSAATMTREPLVEGRLLRPGCHVDLVGAYAPDMREADDETIRRARVFVDTRAGMRESGDIAEPLRSGLLSEADIAGDLHDLVRTGGPARRTAEEITLFKSVGNAVEDLAAAALVWQRLTGTVSQ